MGGLIFTFEKACWKVDELPCAGRLGRKKRSLDARRKDESIRLSLSCCFQNEMLRFPGFRRTFVVVLPAPEIDTNHDNHNAVGVRVSVTIAAPHGLKNVCIKRLSWFANPGRKRWIASKLCGFVGHSEAIDSNREFLFGLPARAGTRLD